MRKVVLLGVSLLLLASLVVGNQARLGALGDAGMFVRDYSEIYRNPATLGNWDNLMYLELGTSATADEFGGANFQVADYLDIGVNVGRNVGRYNTNSTELDTLGIGASAPGNSFSLMGAFGTDMINLGLGIYKAGSKTHYKNYDENGDVVSDVEKNSGVFGINAGTEMELGGSTILGALDLSFNSLEKVRETSSNKVTDELTDGTELKLDLRSFIPLNSKLEVIPTLGLSNYSFSGEHIEENDSDNSYELGDYSEMALNLGVGANLSMKDADIIFGGTFNYANVEENIDTSRTDIATRTSFPTLYLAVEKPLGDHFVGRLGVNKSIGSTLDKEEYSDGSYEEQISTFNTTPSVSIGAGAKFGDFKIDWELNTSTLFSGTYIVSGNSGDLGLLVTSTYRF